MENEVNVVPVCRAHKDNMSFSDLADMMMNMVREFTVEINKAVESSISRLKAEFTSLHAHYEAKLKLVEHRMEQLNTSLQMALSTNERAANQNKLLIFGIPATPDENLSDHFSSVCSHLGYQNDHHPIAHLTRLPGSKRTPRGNEPVLIDFAMLGQRREFFSKYLRTRTLALKHLGFATDGRIFINEFLPPSSREVLSTARRMKREGKLMKVYTRNGVIHAVNNNDEATVINVAEDLMEPLEVSSSK